ncbi:hypothetical protein [Nocardia sp. XZ_19_385]|uniref:hypothetical protein n=1 Tax=Nocardia sp. XZ_19_385 TaxID=2769488 RepID=UPI00188EE38A|nr:hypothetical protein [Nocardia sp. XZ_19_385]
MSIKVNRNRMWSETTPHQAVRMYAAMDEWGVSWLPSRLLTRNQATTAMVIAETVSKVESQRFPGGTSLDQPASVRANGYGQEWKWIEQWADEIGLNPHQIVHDVACDQANRRTASAGEQHKLAMAVDRRRSR